MAAIIPTLERHLTYTKIKALEDARHRDLILTQLACAFNERGYGADASRLFHRPEIRQLFDSDTDAIWPKTQLIRNLAFYWAVHGERLDVTFDLTRRAEQLRRDDPVNLRAAATIHWTAYLRKGSGFKKAWEDMEPHYQHARSQLISAAADNDPAVSGLLHLYSGLYCGATARVLSGKGYPSRSELKDDVHALNWCQSFAHIQLHDELLDFPSNALPAELQEVHQRSLRRHFTPFEAGELRRFERLLTGDD